MQHRGFRISTCSVLAMLAVPAAAAPRLTPAQTALIDRLTWGSNATNAAVLARLGTARWIYRQLHPERSTALPAEAAARIAALPVMAAPMIDTVRSIDDLNRAENALTDPDAKATAKKVYNDALGAAGHQAAERSILLAL